MESVTRPHRRRREKKLMAMDEVNERFPLSKYKNWVAAREREGLPTNGGVTAPETRPNTARGVDEVMTAAPTGFDFINAKPDIKSDSKVSEIALVTGSQGGDGKGTGVTNVEEKGGISPDGDEHHALETVQTTASTVDKHALPDVDDEDDDDHIHTAVPADLLATPGDTCAICIDALEEDNDIRGLTCGHAFHAGCIDPWLTARRASCPLCKADYYVPKPRPEGAEAVSEIDRAFQVNNAGINLPQPPRAVRTNNTRRDLLGLMDRRGNNRSAARDRPQPVTPNVSSESSSRSWRPNIRAALNSVNFRPYDRRDRPSPSQLEAGAGRPS